MSLVNFGLTLNSGLVNLLCMGAVGCSIHVGLPTMEVIVFIDGSPSLVTGKLLLSSRRVSLIFFFIVIDANSRCLMSCWGLVGEWLAIDSRWFARW